MGGPARSWVSVICETVLFHYLMRGGNAEALDGLFQRADFPIKVALLFYHYVKNVSS